MKTFFLNIQSELLKIRRSSAVWLAFFSGAFVPVINFIAIINRPNFFLKFYGPDPWAKYISRNWESALPFLLPLFIILLCSLVVQIEYRNGTWKQIFASPRRYADIYFSKFIVMLLLIIFSLGVFDAAVVTCGYAVSLINGKFAFISKRLPMMELLKMTERVFVSVLGISAIQYWTSMRFRNFIISVGTGFGAVIGSFVLLRWEHARYIPYLYHFWVYKELTEGVPQKAYDTMLYSAVVCSVVLLAGYADMVYKRQKA